MEKRKELIFLNEPSHPKFSRFEILNLINGYDHLDDKAKVYSPIFLFDQHN